MTITINPLVNEKIHTINLGTKEFINNPYLAYKLLRNKYPVCLTTNGEYVLSRFTDVREAALNWRLFSSQNVKGMLKPDWLPKKYHRSLFIISDDPPAHNQRRGLMNKSFIPRVINALVPLMTLTATNLCQALEKNRPLDFLHAFVYPYIATVISRLAGSEHYLDTAKLYEWVHELDGVSTNQPSEEKIDKMIASIEAMRESFENIIEKLQKDTSNDPITGSIRSILLDRSLSHDDRLNIIELFIKGGFDTTAQMLCGALIQLSREPVLLRELTAEPGKIPLFIEELLRFRGPAGYAPRYATQDITLHGITIPRGSQVLLGLAAANRDPQQFSLPDTFDINRPNAKTHIAFGYGVHTCIGSALARLEIKTALEILMDYFRCKNITTIKCPPEEALEKIDSFILPGVKSLSVTLS